MARTQRTVMVDDELEETMQEFQRQYYLDHDTQLSRSDLFNWMGFLVFGEPIDPDDLETLIEYSPIADVVTRTPLSEGRVRLAGADVDDNDDLTLIVRPASGTEETTAPTATPTQDDDDT